MENKRKLLLIVLVLSLFTLLFFRLFFPKPAVSPLKKESGEKEYFPSLPPQRTIVLRAVGDVMLGRMVNVKMLENNDFKYPFLKTAELLSTADLTFGNLESPIIDNCKTTKTGMVFCGRKESIEGLFFAGFDIVSIANNHILNQGREGRKQTIKLLSEKNILASDSENLAIVNVNGVSFGFLSFDLTVTNNPEPLVKKVKESVSKADLVIVSLHWGAEYLKEPFPWQKELGRKLIDEGVKVVIGHHPHVTQPTEEYKDGLIFYSLGNFVFDQMWSEETKKGQIAEIFFEEKQIKSYKTIPIYITDYCQPVLGSSR
ncbi:CapA family protein [Candidatus Microgenomates bacterium]|jgi:poly-gamma-glutamate synthesis protein (capsule biosynthesis protein)|nr:MAG: CapA family protein [Candidatus Microgenomates bacterium]